MEHRLLVGIPALDESKTVATVVGRVPRSIPGVNRVDVLVVDDGSHDSTAAEAAAAGARVICHRRNRGLGASFRTSLGAARAGGHTILVTIDADGQFDAADIPSLVEPIVSGRADVVTCSRFLSSGSSFPLVKRLGNRLVASTVSSLCGLRIHDATCGFRAYGPLALEQISSFSRFTYTQEALIDLAWKGLDILEVPLPVRPSREHGKSRISSNLWRYAALSLGAMYSAAHDHMPWRFYGLPGLLLILAGLAMEIFVFVRWLLVSLITPFKGVAIAGLFLVVLGLLLLMVASLADTSSHTRHLLEDLIAADVRKNRGEDA